MTAQNPRRRAAADVVSPKVAASTTGAAAVTVLAYLLGEIELVAGLPEPVRAALLVLLIAGATFGAGYARTDPLRR